MVRKWDSKKEDGSSVWKEYNAPPSIPDYRANMGGVDRIDQGIVSSSAPLRNKRWPLAFVWWAVSVSVLSGHTLYNFFMADIDQLEPFNFQTELIRELLKYAKELRGTSVKERKRTNPEVSSAEDPTTKKKKVPVFGAKASETRFLEPGHYSVSTSRSHCVVCTMKGLFVRTSSHCVTCDTCLCPPSFGDDGKLRGCHVVFHDE